MDENKDQEMSDDIIDKKDDINHILIHDVSLSDQYHKILNERLKSSGVTKPNKHQIMNAAIKHLKIEKYDLFNKIKEEDKLSDDELPNNHDIAKKAKEYYDLLIKNMNHDYDKKSDEERKNDIIRLANLNLIAHKRLPKDIYFMFFPQKPLEEQKEKPFNLYDKHIIDNWNRLTQKEKDHFYFKIIKPEELKEIVRLYSLRTNITDPNKIKSENFIADDINFLFNDSKEPNKEVNNYDNILVKMNKNDEKNIDVAYDIIQKELKKNEKLNKAFNKYLFENKISNPSNGDIVKHYNIFLIDNNKDEVFKNFYENENTKQSLDNYKNAHEYIEAVNDKINNYNDNSSTISSISTNSGTTETSNATTNTATTATTNTTNTTHDTDVEMDESVDQSEIEDDDTTYSKTTEDILTFNSEYFGEHTDITDLFIENDDYEKNVQERLVKYVESLDHFTILLGNQINEINKTKNNYNKFTIPQYNRLRNYIQAIHIISNDLISNKHQINFMVDTNYHPTNDTYEIQNYEEKSKYYHKILPEVETFEETMIMPTKIMLGAVINILNMLYGILYKINKNSTDLLKEKKEQIIKRKDLYLDIGKVLMYLPIHN